MLRLTLTLLAVAALVNASPAAARQSAAPTGPTVTTAPVVPTVTTVGEGVVRRAADRAIVTLSVESRAPNPRDAQRQTADAMAAVQKRLGELGLPSSALRTIGYTVEQEFDFEAGRRTLRGYVARNGVDVTLDEVARAGEIIDAGVRAGATGVAVRFDLRDREAAEREALRLAVADARARAEAAASGAGTTIHSVLKIEDLRGGSPTPVAYAPRAAGAASLQAQGAPPLVPGLIEIRESVSLTASMR